MLPTSPDTFTQVRERFPFCRTLAQQKALAQELTGGSVPALLALARSLGVLDAPQGAPRH